MRKLLIMLIVLITFNVTSPSANYPYPQQIDFEGAIKPNNVTQKEMNQSVSEYYDWWKGFYVKESNGVTNSGGYYVMYKQTYNNDKKITVSEAHGYGMIIFALMAGYDSEAKKYYDGMYNMYDKHRSTINDNLMSWVISETEEVSKDDDCATDGDMDIAYSLLLADKQWGSDGKIDYLQEAKRIITDGIKKSLVDDKSRLRLGDWATSGIYLNTTRPSDWMPGHLEAYRVATNDDIWSDVKSEIYNMTYSLQDNYSPNTGLLPDFVVGDTPKPSDPNFLESENDGNYNWNSCRTPWRLTTDYLHNGDIDAKKSVTKMIDWIVEKTGGDVNKIYDGYTLDGVELTKESWNQTTAFSAPFITAATINSKYQDFLNSGWDLIKANKGGAYFGNTINLLNMLLISGNWWRPNLDGTSVYNEQIIVDEVKISSIYPNPFNPIVNIKFEINNSAKVNLTVYDVKGRVVQTLINKLISNGSHTVTWNATNSLGNKVSSGIYFAKLSVNSSVVTKKLLLTK